MDSSVMIIGGGILVFFIAIVVYVLLMVFLPEWVGITGKTALDAEKSHQGGEVTEGSFFTGIEPEAKKKNTEPR